MDCWNGSSANVQTFRDFTMSTYPLCLNASVTQFSYNLFHDYAVVIDQNGIIRYKQAGINIGEIQSVIDDLLMPSPVEDSNSRQIKFELQQNYPNPFNPQTQIGFTLDRRQHINIEIFDITGKRVKTLLNEELASGRHQVYWDGRNSDFEFVAAGVYFYSLKGESAAMTKKMLLTR